jgi:transcriptional regulator with XRE-family HTH domain
MILSDMSGNHIVKQFGQMLQDRRAERGLTLRELAALAKTSHQTVAAFEAGDAIHLPTFIRISGQLGLSLELRENETSAE